MPNPYFPATYNPSDYGLTVFQPDMVLTADQLNLMFGYLLHQEHRTRTRLIGVGVVCGLQVRLNPGPSITVSAGCGVTTEGDLLSLEESKTYTEFAPYNLSDHPEYSPFLTIKDLELWELFPAAYPSQVSKKPLSGLDLEDKVVLLYLESAVQSADACTGVACDNKGDAFLNRLHVLLARQADALALITAGHRTAATACSRLPVLPMPRVRLNDLDYSTSLTRFRSFLLEAANQFAAGLQRAYAEVSAVEGITPVAEWVRVLLAKADQYSRDANCQYVYGWLKDLHEAYAEFREATCHWLVQCLPLETAFPKHLLLGELKLAPGACRPEYRHAFLRSPAVAAGADGRQKALWLYARLGRLIDLFEVPAPRTDTFTIIGRGRFTVLHSLRFTPDHLRGTPLSRRSLPFYYRPEMRASWSYDLSQRCRTAAIPSFHVPAGAPPEVARPFDYQVEPYAFYRIEGFMGADLPTVLQQVLSFRKEYNLAFEVLALRADAAQSLLTEGGTLNFEDIAVDFEDLREQVRCHEKDALRGPGDALSVNLNMTRAIFQRTVAAYRQKLSPKHPATPCILPKLPLLERLHTRYLDRKAQFERRLTFGPFLQEHPGLEHGAGVPRGGTFILVYKSTARQGNTINRRVEIGAPVVVADFYLPYRCCPGGDTVQFVLPEPPPTLDMARTRFCLNDKPEKITVSPSGGSFDSPLVSRQEDDFLFSPTTVGSYPLTYTAPNGKTASLTVTVLALPTAAFRVGQQQEGKKGHISLTNASTHATQITWDFGDGSDPETISLSGSQNGDTQHTYILPDTGAGAFAVRLTASNGTCQAEARQEVVFKARPEIRLSAEEIVCFNREQRQKVKAEPEGGDFSSPTLKILKKGGEYPPNLPGTHTITYTLDDQSASLQVFVVPNSLKVESIELVGRNLEALVIAPTPPDALRYEWELNGKATRPAAEKKDARGNTLYTFRLTPNDQGELVLIFKVGDKELCERVGTKISF